MPPYQAGAEGQNSYVPPVNPGGTVSQGQQPYVPSANQSGMSPAGETVAEENKDSNENE
jgi:hypothetical protein